VKLMKIVIVLLILFLGIVSGYIAAMCIQDAEAKTVRALSKTTASKPVSATSLSRPTSKAPVRVREIRSVKKQIRIIPRTITTTSPISIKAPAEPVASELGGKLKDNFTMSPGKNIDISLEAEHFWAYEDGILVLDQPISAALGPTVPVGELGDQAHNHLGIWYVYKKVPLHHSKAYDCDMRLCLFYCDGHALHACQWSDIDRLGMKASHGCIRQHPKMAKKVYDWADLATRVRVRE